MRLPALPMLRLCAALVVVPSAAAAQSTPPCPGGREYAGDLGIIGLRCVGPAASCVIYQEEDGVTRHEFSVEPIVAELEPTATNGEGLREGDIVVALDGRLITTREGGRYMANLPVGRTVEVLVRRGHELLTRSVPTREGCGVTSLSVRWTPT